MSPITQNLIKYKIMKILKYIIPILIFIVLWFFIPQDTLNNVARKRIELTDGNYRVTYSQDTIVKTYNIKSGKITSTSKGYYFFFRDTSNGLKYTQTPIDKTIIEEL